jgi:DNA-binding NtrC family response regulator
MVKPPALVVPSSAADDPQRMGSERAQIVFVDDDGSFRPIMAREIERMGYSVRAFADAAGVAEHVCASPPAAMVLDLKLPGEGGMQLLERLLAQEPDLQVIVLTGHGAVLEAVQAMRAGAFDFLTKPVSLDVLEQALKRAVATSALIAENRWLRRVAAQGDALLLTSPMSRRIEAQIDRIGPSEKNVLICGESGVGKELVARRLHAESSRRNRPFLAVNCGAIPRSLVESELFGHVRGAFTGANAERPGLFDAADGGTLFLDEVGEFPLDLQPALLRAVQFGEVRPVGSDGAHTVDVRVVAATHRDLRAGIEARTFREDLFYRIAVFELDVPPLRERRDDVIALARHFLAREGARSGRPLRLDDSAEAWLASREWPGNVRELENAIVRLAVLARGSVISVSEAQSILEASGGRARAVEELPTLRLRDLERLAIGQALARHGGNKTRAAEELGIALKTLYNKLG